MRHQPMTPSILSEDTIIALRQLYPPLSNLVPPPIFEWVWVGFLGLYMNISQDVSYQKTHP